MKTKASNNDGLQFSKKSQTGEKAYSPEEKRSMVQTESDLQSLCESYLDKTGWVKPGAINEAASTQIIKGIYVHVPNAAFSRNRGVIAALKNLPDLILYHPDGRYTSFELKSRSGKRQRGQRALAKYMKIEEEKVFENFVAAVEKWY